MKFPLKEKSKGYFSSKAISVILYQKMYSWNDHKLKLWWHEIYVNSTDILVHFTAIF